MEVTTTRLPNDFAFLSSTAFPLGIATQLGLRNLRPPLRGFIKQMILESCEVRSTGF